jgi:hypothetical protein
MANKNYQGAVVHHRVRTTLAAICGTIALALVLASLLVVWANHTLTDTPTFVSTVGPMVTQPAVQNFVATKAADQLLESAPTKDLAELLLPASETTGKTFDQLTVLVRPVLTADIKEIVASPAFATLWKNTNQSAHAQLISQLKSGSSTLTLDLSPAVVGAINQLKQSKLASISDKIEVTPTAGKFDVKGGAIEKAHTYYNQFQQGTLALVIITLILIGLSVWLSVHHTKTLRRILIGTGAIALLIAALLQAPSIIKLHTSDPVTYAAAVAIAQTLFHGLKVTCVILALACLVLAIGSKFTERLHLRH